MDDLPPGDYRVQAFMNVYTTFRRSDGSVVKLHMPCGDGHDVFNGTGNLYSSVQTVRVRPGDRRPVQLSLTEVIPPSDPVPPGGTCQQGNPPDSPHVKHVKIKSELLSRYWGQPMYIAANVLLPAGYDEHPDARYPVVYQHGHYPGPSPFSFREDGGNAFSQWWLSKEPRDRVIAVTFRHENPFYDDSYAVNSANLGPYGDAITKELMVELDRRFRTMGASWARSLTGGSTGGWESLAQQVFYPDLYAGTFSTCPDPVDFRYHQIVNVYSDPNAYYTELDWNRVPRPGARSVDGNVRYTMEDENHYELAIGGRGRSGGQWDIWEAVYGPQGGDGYPARVWDKLTGEIDHTVAERWRPMDIRDHLVTNWSTLAPKLTGKLHIYVGDDDTYYLETPSSCSRSRWQRCSRPPTRRSSTATSSRTATPRSRPRRT
ncbi:alpha/beta hydrolase-fold protein [Candidatus Solirubrobacter pratensis]|uniref:alpha/beta hydrolase-fold protein n=1 Tax=Candidatus Solirubrobacter pratensis TaxID=1298857 RepID=UPI0004268FD6|nr:alpha/beta hydrolase-fold protein [Candidatus Solirubrobacter pratensis]